MKKDHRSGGKFGSNHTTVVAAAGHLCDIAHQQPEVTKISLGFIKSGLRSLEGKKRAKVTMRPGNLFLSVRDNSSNQELTIYTDDTKKTRQALYRGGKEYDIEVRFT
jgi:hypothetical protein